MHTAAVKSSTWASWAETSNVGDIALEQLLHDTRAIAADYLTADPVALFIRTCALRDRVFRLLEGHQPPRQSTELYVAGGYLCALLAWMSSDLGQLRDADTQGRTAWLCAELADHNGLRAWTLSTRSKVAFWDGRLRDAVNYARQGALYTAPGTVGTLLACQEADAWSVLGARDETDTALQRASQARETQRGQDDIGGLFSCPPLRHANYASAAHLRCGDPQRALAEATAALTQQAGHAYGTVAQVHISAAGAHLALNSPDGAAQALQPVFALPPERRLAPVTARVQELARPLTQTRLVGTVARSLRQRIEDFALDSASRHALTTS
ncbi:XRE family transcriptional regulator [Streptomyces sp. PTM05]|uniref:XRE family transcriptional regulator n=1 Tax=Streptantibioticus parmotrematis TaxID=2873249 RepID=A0ABS7R5H9_9ACTN|nr:XRE family transcriptional regulator [Streptantibioticus parmotrematis]